MTPHFRPPLYLSSSRGAAVFGCTLALVGPPLIALDTLPDDWPDTGSHWSGFGAQTAGTAFVQQLTEVEGLPPAARAGALDVSVVRRFGSPLDAA